MVANFETVDTFMINLFRIDMTIGPIEESFALLNKYGLHYSSHDSERVDSLTYSWKKVNSQVFLLE
jgi:dynein heavy chain